MEPLLINILSMTFEMLLNIIYVDDIAIFRVINSADDCTMIQFLIYCVQGWRTPDLIKLNTGKRTAVTFPWTTNPLKYCNLPPVNWPAHGYGL